MGYSTVKNVGAIAFTASGQQNTKSNQTADGPYGGGLPAFGDSVGGTVKVVYENREYVWGPNDSKTLEDGIAAACVAASNSRLRIIDTRDGVNRSGGKGVN